MLRYWIAEEIRGRLKVDAPDITFRRINPEPATRADRAVWRPYDFANGVDTGIRTADPQCELVSDIDIVDVSGDGPVVLFLG